MNRTGDGIPATSPAPRRRKGSAAAPKSLTLRPCVRTKARPRASDSMPRVGTKGGIPIRVTKKPLSAPAPRPAPIAAATPMPRPPSWLRRTPATTPASPRTEPADRSMPPVITTRAWPIPMMVTNETLRATFRRFWAVQKTNGTLRRTQRAIWKPARRFVTFRTGRKKSTTQPCRPMASC